MTPLWPAGVNRVWHKDPVSREFYADAPTKPGRRSNYVEPDPDDAKAWLAAMRAEGQLVDDQDLADKVAAESRDLRGEFA